MTQTNTSFSPSLPGFQWAIDSTSLGEAKLCPQKYYLSIVRGFQPREESPHLRFGLLLHEGRERYEKFRFANLSATHDEALDEVLDWALKATWDQRMKRAWISGHNLKNRQTLIQTLVWYLDAQAQNDSLVTIRLANGKPAVELSFRFDSGLKVGGESIIFCGHLDRLASLNDKIYVPDIKTSSSEPTARWAQQFSPGNQFSMYTLTGRVAFEQRVEGVMVDGIQVGVGFSRFARHLVPRTDQLLEEWREDVGYWVSQMYLWASQGKWPHNDKVCDLYGGCQFRSICNRSPGQRENWLKTEFQQRVWDPLQSRES